MKLFVHGNHRSIITGRRHAAASSNRCGWMLIESITAMGLFTIALSASLVTLEAILRSHRLQRQTAIASAETRNIANWISVQDRQRLEGETIEVPPELFPTPAASRDLRGLRIEVAAKSVSDDATDFRRFDIAVRWEAFAGQESTALLSTWRAWELADE